VSVVIFVPLVVEGIHVFQFLECGMGSYLSHDECIVRKLQQSVGIRVFVLKDKGEGLGQSTKLYATQCTRDDSRLTGIRDPSMASGERLSAQ
jgi:hypothetical protein